MQLHDLRIVRATLDNGLRVICVQQPALHTAAVTMHLRVGSRFETPSSNGRSHFLEHMLYRGTRSFGSAHEQALALERLGGMLYAATHTDHGLMSLSGPPETLLQSFAIFAEVATSPRYTEMEIERGIIREEILESLDEHGKQVDPDNLSRELIYSDHGLGLPITGTPETINKITVEDLRAHHKLHYTTANTVLCFAGAIDADACIDAATRHLGNMDRGERVAVEPPPDDQKAARFTYVENQSSQTDLRLAFRAPGEHAIDEPAAEVLVRLLDDGMSTRLYRSICDEKGLCYDVSADYETYEDDGVIDLAAAVQHARAPLVMRELCEVVRSLAVDGPDADELRKVQDRHRWEIRTLLDDAEGLAAFHGLAALAEISDTIESRHDEIARVTRDQVVQVARRVFAPSGINAVAVGLLSKQDRRALERVLAEFKLR